MKKFFLMAVLAVLVSGCAQPGLGTGTGGEGSAYESPPAGWAPPADPWAGGTPGYAAGPGEDAGARLGNAECDAIYDVNEREMCYVKIAMDTKDASICPKLNLEADQCYDGVANRTQNVALCDNIVNAGRQSLCYLAFSEDDPSLCAKMGDESIRDQCYSDAAYHTGDKSYCENIESEISRQLCEI